MKSIYTISHLIRLEIVNLIYKVLIEKHKLPTTQIRTADLRIFHCPFIEGKTIETKTISSGRKDGIVRRLKEAKGQSENVLVDVTSFPYDEDIIKHEIRKYFTKHETIKIIAVKKYNDLLFVWQKV